ncbi:MAG: DHH family phosphoesterase [Clostridia bacterium]|nr:DHH family phosphoesterase [Clostridia bacterium]
MGLYFVALLLFAGAAAALRQYTVAAAEVGVIVMLFIYNRVASGRRKKALMNYIQSTTDSLGTAFRSGSPFPAAVIKMSDSEIVWANDAFYKISGLKDTFFHQKMDDVIPRFSTRWLTEGRSECPQDVEIQGRRYRVYGGLIRSEDEHASLLLATLYLADMTEMFNIRDEFNRTRPIVSMILVDNYDELTNNLPDSAISSLDAQINDRIGQWCRNLNGLLRKYERNRYLLVFEAKDLPRLQEAKFTILDEIRTITNPSGVAATLSIGIGKDGSSFQENFQFAGLSIEMALSRGGDQVVIKDRYNFTFFGGRTKETERRTKVKARVIANSLAELINQSGLVLVMGHRMADLDALGAAMGLVTICRKLGKTVRIVLDKENNAARSLLENLALYPEYEGLFISDEDALLAADNRSLLVVVDTNRPDQVESRALLESITRVAVIDHHRRAADYIEQPVLNLHEPFASSASELVSEILQYAVEPKDIHPMEAQALLSGIVLDTKNFSIRTGSRTFEAAAFLRRAGADTVDVKKLFQNDLDATVSRYQIVQAARLYRNELAISALDYTVSRPMAAQAADELLNIKGITASFVLFPDGERIMISARSIGEANVQIILEALGGGGNAAIAGAQIPNKDMRTVLQELVASIDKFYEN